MNITVPAVQQQFSTQFSSDANTAAQRIKSTYGSIINAAAASVGIDPNIIVGFMIVENTPADPSAVSYGCSSTAAAEYACAYGLIQLQVATAFQTMKDQAAAGLQPAEMAIIQKYLPGFLKVQGFVGFLASWKKQIYQALLQAEFNIWIGAMQIAQLMAKNVKQFGGDPRLDHIIVMYNRGVGNYNKEVVKAGLENVDTATLVSSLTIEETQDYIIKYLGIDGSLMAAIRN